MAANNASPKGNRLKSISGKLLNSPIGQKLKKRNQSSSVVADSKEQSAHGVQLNAFDTTSLNPQSQVVVAIDFGTTYSGYAYAFRSSPEDIHLMRHPEGGQTVGTVSYKIPTILLLNEQGEFHSFGYEARETYHNLDAAESQKWLYFEKFKMELHSRKELNRRMELEATNGKRIPAVTVFCHGLCYFKNTCLKELAEVSISPEAPLTKDDITWVITVPAIWRQSAKQFMRYAALQAGLISADNPKQLVIALEPEAASIYCRQLRLKECIPDTGSSPPLTSRSPSTGAPKFARSQESFSESSLCKSPHAANLSYGMRYVVADCGGGTVDLTVHELEINGKLKELYKATGGAWGSMGVDCQFEMLLVDIFGEQFLLDFVQMYPISWLELMSSFEAKKRSFNSQKQIPINISLPFAFIDHLKKKSGRSIHSFIKEFEGDGIHWTSQGMLRLQPAVMFSLFEPVVNEVVQHIQHLLNIPELTPITYLFLVGGFAESPTLQEAIQKALQHKLKVIIPQNVSLTILKGAVMFGQDPSLIHVRRSALTYGVGCLNPFIPGKHPPEKRVVKDGVEWCTGLFDTFVFADQSVSLGHTVTRSYTLAQESKQSTKITVYASEKECVKYITDPGCEKVGEMRLEMPAAAEGRCKEVRMTMMFGDTEISVEAVDAASGQTTRAIIDFLNK